MKLVCIFKLVLAGAVAASAITTSGGHGMAAGLAPSVLQGTFSSSCGNGSLWLFFVANRPASVLLASTATGALTDRREGIRIGSSGLLAISGFLGTDAQLSAGITGDVLQGTISGADCSGTVEATKISDEGFMREVGGYYAGTAQMVVQTVVGDGGQFHLQTVETFDAPLSILVAANGAGFALFQTLSPNVSNAAGIITVRPDLVIDCASPGTGCDLPLSGQQSFFESAIGGMFDAQQKNVTGELFVESRSDLITRGEFQFGRIHSLDGVAVNVAPWVNILLLD